jgi:hypothetical protein
MLQINIHRHNANNYHSHLTIGTARPLRRSLILRRLLHLDNPSKWSALPSYESSRVKVSLHFIWEMKPLDGLFVHSGREN